MRLCPADKNNMLVIIEGFNPAMDIRRAA